VRSLPVAGLDFYSGGHIDAMAELFAIVGIVTVGLLGVARWWEER
jgi:hypothetical protein